MNSVHKLWSSILFFLVVLEGAGSTIITFQVTPPVNTPARDTIYISGNLPEIGEWDPGLVALERTASGFWELTREFDLGAQIEYKYTRGSWLTVEKGLNGEEIMNRVYVVSEGDSVLVDTVLAWRDSPRTKSPYLSWSSPPLKTMMVNWETSEPTTGSVVYGMDTVGSDTIVDTSHTYHHVVELEGLEPSATYYYRVFCSNGFESSVSTFRTGSLRDEPFTFVVYGDNRSNAYIHRRIAEEIVDVAPSFLLNTGDLVNDGNNLDDWYLFFNAISELLRKTPYMPTIGNHENNSANYFNLFSLPENERWYSFEFSNARFIALSTEEDYSPGSPQYEWFSQNLSSRPDSIDWVFVYLHRPPYSSGTNHGSDLRVRSILCPLFEEYGVDMVFSGHEHNYERSLVANVYYIVTGGGGAPLYPVGSSEWTIYSESSYHFCSVELADTLLHFKAIRLDGTVMDSFTIKKSSISESRSSVPIRWVKGVPNPFKEVVKIVLLCPEENTMLGIYNSSGSLLKTFLVRKDSSTLPVVYWDGRDSRGNLLPNGVYICRLYSPGFRNTMKLVLLK